MEKNHFKAIIRLNLIIIFQEIKIYLIILDKRIKLLKITILKKIKMKRSQNNYFKKFFIKAKIKQIYPNSKFFNG